jgi:hypothetical protein
LSAGAPKTSSQPQSTTSKKSIVQSLTGDGSKMDNLKMNSALLHFETEIEKMKLDISVSKQTDSMRQQEMD